MPDNRITNLRSTLEQMETGQLDNMLRSELAKEQPDAQAVQVILGILREREKDYPLEMDPGTAQAWQDYIEKTGSKDKSPASGVVLKAASIALILAVLLLSVPQHVEAETLWERLTRWTDSVFELFSPGDRSAAPAEYVFRTDHPGLQQVYDAVVEMGITDPVVPMWLPEGYELVECKVVSSPSKTSIISIYSFEEKTTSIIISIYSKNISKEYYKDEATVQVKEISGTKHNILQNNDLWVVVWEKSNIECSISIDCQEDILFRILQSIYTVEE